MILLQGETIKMLKGRKEREKRKGEKREAREEGQGCNKVQRENHLGWGFWLLSLLVKFHCSLCGEPEH